MVGVIRKSATRQKLLRPKCRRVLTEVALLRIWGRLWPQMWLLKPQPELVSRQDDVLIRIHLSDEKKPKLYVTWVSLFHHPGSSITIFMVWIQGVNYRYSLENSTLHLCLCRPATTVSPDQPPCFMVHVREATWVLKGANTDIYDACRDGVR